MVHNGNNFIPIDCSRFAAGGYLIKVTNTNGAVLVSQKLLVAAE
jgi:hypothetical protein